LSDEVIQQTLVKQIAALKLQGVSGNDIAKQLKLSRYAVQKTINSDEFKAELKQLADRAVEGALLAFKSKIESLEPLAYAALKSNLQEGQLEAVKVWARFVGMDDKREEKADNQIQIILPGQQEVKTVVSEPLHEVRSDDNQNSGT
jgi:adenine specific DNA methylase Mod